MQMCYSCVVARSSELSISRAHRPSRTGHSFSVQVEGPSKHVHLVVGLHDALTVFPSFWLELVAGALPASCCLWGSAKGRDQTVRSHPRIVRIAVDFYFLLVCQAWSDRMDGAVH